MQVEVIDGKDLSHRQANQWAEQQKLDVTLDSPFLHPSFTRSVAAVRRDVKVAILRDGTESLGFFPFQRGFAGAGRPVGCGLSEQQAVIAPQLRWSYQELLAKCGLRSYAFDHLCGDQVTRFGRHALVDDSPAIDLQDGFDSYLTQARRKSSSTVAQTLRKARKLEREVGPLRFTLHDESHNAFRSLLDWKSQQHQETGVLDTFRIDWVVDFLDAIRKVQESDFASSLSTLHAGGRLIAVHLGLRTATTAHVWFPAYDRQYSRYSPGLVLFLRYFEELSRLGVRRIDFGPGPQRYKKSFQNCSTKVALGSVDRSVAVATVRRGAAEVKQRLKASSLGGALGTPANMLFRLRQWLAFQS